MKPRDIIGLIVAIAFSIGAWIILGKVSLLISAMPYDASPIPPAVKFLHIIIYIAVTKWLLSFHFSWEKCECCGRRHGEHKDEDWWRVQDLSLPPPTKAELEASKAKIKKTIDKKYTRNLAIREGDTLSNVKSSPDVARPTGSPPPPVRPTCPPWRCIACGTIHAAK